MADMGIRTVAEMVGRVDLLDTRRMERHWKARGIDLSKILHRVAIKDGASLRQRGVQDHGLEGALDNRLIADCRAAIDTKAPVQIAYDVRNVNRTVGAMLSGEIAKAHGHEGLPGDTIRINLTGVAGQSFGAWLAHGVTLDLVGDANDYVGKGLSGGRIIVRQPAAAPRNAQDNIIVGNTVLYGAIAGEAYFNGVAGERFAVRNSGAIAVVEGTGDHGCEYMTGGVAAILGAVGDNFGAGMTGGIAFVYDERAEFEERVNPENVIWQGLASAHWEGVLKAMIARHVAETDSPRGAELLRTWEEARGRFVQVCPKEMVGRLSHPLSDEGAALRA